MPNHHLVRALPLLVLAVSLLAPSARGELAAWDPAEATRLAKDLAAATDALYETFMQQPPPPNPGSTQSESYYRLRHRVWMLRSEARVLVRSLEEGDAREQTELTYDMLMSHARSARYEASGAFVAKDVGERAAAVRGVLNQLGPFYDPDFRTLSPDPNIEAGATRPTPR
jgi:hypothetical protein